MSADSASGGKRQLQSIRLNLCQWLGLKMLEICLKIIWVESHQTIIILSKYGFSLKVSKDSEEFISNLIQFGYLESFLHLSLNHAACVDVWWRVQGEYLVWPRKALTPSVWTMLGGFYYNIFSIHPLFEVIFWEISKTKGLLNENSRNTSVSWKQLKRMFPILRGNEKRRMSSP